MCHRAGKQRYTRAFGERYLENDPLAQAIAHGYQIGRDVASLMAFKYEKDWERSVAAWREELHIEPAPPISSAALKARWR